LPLRKCSRRIRPIVSTVSIPFTACFESKRAAHQDRLQGAHCLTKNVTGRMTARTGAGTPNRIGVADGGTDQHGRAA